MKTIFTRSERAPGDERTTTGPASGPACPRCGRRFDRVQDPFGRWFVCARCGSRATVAHPSILDDVAALEVGKRKHILETMRDARRRESELLAEIRRLREELERERAARRPVRALFRRLRDAERRPQLSGGP